MKKWILFLLAATAGFADQIMLDNQIQKQKVAIQWADSANEVNQANQAMMSGAKLKAIQVLKQTGPLKVKVPSGAEYFRVVAWSKEASLPDFVTNWVDVVSDKTYVLDEDYLVPAVLMQGTGC